MAITTIDGLVAALASGQLIPLQKASASSVVAGRYFTSWNISGNPGAGSLSIGNTANGLVPTDATTGAPLIAAFDSGATGYLGQWTINCSYGGVWRLVDRLFHAGSFTASSTGTSNLSSQPSFSSRLPGGSYVGVEAWLEVNAANGATATTVSIGYTNQDGTTGRTATLDNDLTSYVTRSMLPFRLQSGDTGIQKVDSVTVGGATGTVTFNIVLVRALDQMIMINNYPESAHDAFKTGLPIVYEDTCLFLMVCSASTSTGTLISQINIING